MILEFDLVSPPTWLGFCFVMFCYLELETVELFFRHQMQGCLEELYTWVLGLKKKQRKRVTLNDRTSNPIAKRTHVVP